MVCSATDLIAIRKGLSTRHGLTEDQVSALMVVPSNTEAFTCWLEAIMYYLRTNDLLGMVMKLVTCLLAKKLVTQDSILDCFWAFVMSLIGGMDWSEAVIRFFTCVFGGVPDDPGNGNGGNGGSVPPGNWGSVPRCG